MNNKMYNQRVEMSRPLLSIQSNEDAPITDKAVTIALAVSDRYGLECVSFRFHVRLRDMLVL